MDDEEELEASAWARYEWDCPACFETNQVDHDPQGETLECEECDAEVRITGSH